MNCSRVKNLVSAYLDRELNGETMLEVQRHLRCCERCTVELESMRRVKQLLAESKVVEPDTESLKRTHEAVFSSAPARASKSPVAGLVAMASALAAATISVFAAQNTPHGAAAAPDLRATEARVSPLVVSGSDPFGGYAPTIPVSVHRD